MSQWKSNIKGIMLRHFPLMITCVEFEKFILDYLEDNLPAKQKKIFQMHLLFCKECKAYLMAYQRTIQMGKAAFRDPNASLPDDVPEDLVRAILDARSAES